MGNFATALPQSIYKNALPLYSDRIDATFLDNENDQFAEKLLHTLLHNPSALQANASDAVAKKLLHLYFETRNSERTKGQNSLKLGFPLFMHASAEKLVIAPLFHFSIQLEPSQNHINSWIINGQAHKVEVNNWLLNYWQDELGVIDLGEKMRNWTQSGTLSYEKLHEMHEMMEQHLGFHQIGMPTQIVPAPGIDVIGVIPEGGAVQWSGVLGIFPPQWKEFESEAKDLTEIFKNSPLPDLGDAHSFGLLSVDPHQETAFHTAQQQRLTVIDGQQGSGKTHTLVQLLTNILSNGERCLIVSDSIRALKKTQEQLSRLKLDRYNFLLKDMNIEQDLLLEIMRSAAENTTQKTTFQANQYRLTLEQIRRAQQKLDANYQAVRKPIFGNYNWTDLVGLFLRSNRTEGRELLSAQLNHQDFAFNYKEYQDLKVGILSSHALYPKVNSLKHPLTNLHDSLFTECTRNEAEIRLKAEPIALLQKASDLHYKYMSTTHAYAAKLRDHYDLHYRNLAFRVRQLEEKISDYTTQYGSTFENGNNGTLRLLGTFSSHKRTVLNARREVALAYEGLMQLFNEKRYFDYTFAPTNENKDIPAISENLVTFEAALTPWRKQLDHLIADDMQRLTQKSVLPVLNYAEPIAELETELDDLVNIINDAQLYDVSLANKMLTITHRQKYLEQIMEQLEKTRHDLRDFDAFYPWQRNWLSLTAMNHKVIRALVKVKPNDWMAAFESWYFHQYLTKHFSEHLPTDDAILAEFEQLHLQVQQLLPGQIDYTRQERQVSALQALKTSNRRVYDRLFTRTKPLDNIQATFPDLYATGKDAVSEIIPILLASPAVAQQLVPEEPDYYDYVFFIETNQFLPEDMQRIAQSGKRVVMISDPSLDNDFSLSEFAKENGAATVTLKNRYSKNKLAEVAFKDQKEGHAPHLEVAHVEGRFKSKSGTNDVEAQYVLRLLNNIQRSPQRTFPSVGIVTFTTEQRDLVAAYLLKIKQQNATGAEKIRQLERNGLGIFHIEEMYGQDFDVLIVSLTFGIVNLKGSLGRRFQFLQTPEGTKGVKLLINKSLQKTYLINSIPKVHLNTFTEQPEKEGTWLLANLLAYADALNGTDAKAIQNYRQAIWKDQEETSHTSIFLEEVAYKMQSYFEAKQLHQHEVLAGHHLPLNIASDGDEPLLVHPDLFFAKTPTTSFFWEAEHRHKLDDACIAIQPIWSVQWWKNPHQAARRLASYLLKQQPNTTEKVAQTASDSANVV